MKNTDLSQWLGICLIGMIITSFDLQAEEFRIEFDWDSGMKSCFSRVSPEIKLFSVPEGTKQLSVNMKDRQSNYYHGGGKFAYNGESSIPAGALKSWKGPCPPVPEMHTYVFTVKAKGGKKARARFARKFKQ